MASKLHNVNIIRNEIDSCEGKNESFGHPGVLGIKHFFCWDWGFEERQQRAASYEI